MLGLGLGWGWVEAAQHTIPRDTGLVGLQMGSESHPATMGMFYDKLLFTIRKVYKKNLTKLN